MKQNDLLYIKIENHIIEKIKDRTYKENDKLPTENELCEQFGVSRMTVHKALSNLAEKGYIKRIPGSGSFVKLTNIERQLPLMQSFSEEHSKYGKIESKLIQYSVLKANFCPALCRHIEVDPEEFIHYFVRLRVCDGHPLALSYNYVLVKVVPSLNVNALEKSFYAYLEKDLGLVLGHNETIIRVVQPDKEVKKYLEIQENDPVILSSHVSYLSDDVPFEYAETYYLSDKYSFKYNAYRH